MTDNTLHAQVDDTDVPNVVSLRSLPRLFDPLQPYIDGAETDGGPEYRPGGKRYAHVQLAIPGGPHRIGALLEFYDVDTVDALLYQLGIVRVKLNERFTPEDFFEDGDA